MNLRSITLVMMAAVFATNAFSQALRIPQTTNITNTIGRKVGVTDIQIRYSTGVKGREGKIYGTDVVPFGYTVPEDIRRQLSGAIGFDPASLEAAAQRCMAH
jgi:hypothetical protein